MSKYLVGIDEAGRGPLAGPLTLSAFAVKREYQAILEEFPDRDSKKLSEKKREEIFKRLIELKRSNMVGFTICHISNTQIDKIGMSKCLKVGVKKCLSALDLKQAECCVMLDGGLKAPEEYKQETIIKGDEKVKVISLASVVAKVSRDKKMKFLARKYKNYGFEKHKGYGTKEHYKNIRKLGLTGIHRITFLNS